MKAGEDKNDVLWKLLHHMVNLEALELYSYDPYLKYDPTPLDGAPLPLPRLRFAKSWGYFPREFVRSVVVGFAPTLERLELGLLDRPDDRPDASVFNINTPSPLGFLPSHQRAAGDTLDQGTSAPISFPKLKHLHLSKPSEGTTDTLSRLYVFYSPEARSACADDWRGLLTGAEKTVETLVLEHRLSFNKGLIYRGELSREVSRNHSRGSDESFFANTVVPLLLSNEGTFKQLREIYLYGVYIDPTKSMVDREKLVDLCQRRGVKCERREGWVCTFDEFDGRTSDWNVCRDL